MNPYMLLVDVLLWVRIIMDFVPLAGLILILIGWKRGWRWIRHPWIRLAHVVLALYVVIDEWTEPYSLDGLIWHLIINHGPREWENTTGSYLLESARLVMRVTPGNGVNFLIFIALIICLFRLPPAWHHPNQEAPQAP